MTTTLTAYPPQAPSFLWHPRIPRKKLSLLAADPGLGKTSLALHLAANLSSATPLPQMNNEQGIINAPAATLLLSPHDCIADTLRPRLDAMHADPAHIHLLPDFHSLIPSKADPTPLQTLHNAAAAIPNLALLILDPITHFLGLTDRTINQAQGPQSLGRGGAAGRSTLHALAQLAESRNIAILLTTRLTKKLPAPSRDSLPHLHRTLGSLAFSAAARSTLLILPYTTPHLTNPTNTPIEPNRLLLSLKSNLTPPIPPLPFTLTQTLTFHPEIPLDDLFAPKTADPLSKDTLLADAVRFLQSFLADGPRRATHINDAALQNAVSIATLRRAKSHLQLDTHFDHRHRAWFWFLKDDPRPVPSPAEHLQKEMSALSASLRALHIPSLEDLL